MAQRLAATIIGRVQDDFEADCSRLLAMCRISEPELKRLAVTDFLADHMVRFHCNGAALRLLSDALAQDRLARVIRGQEEAAMAAPGTAWANAQPATLQTRLLNVEGRVVETCRRICLQLPSSLPYQETWHTIHGWLAHQA